MDTQTPADNRPRVSSTVSLPCPSEETSVQPAASGPTAEVDCVSSDGLMIRITGIGNGICLGRNLITHFFTVNHRATNTRNGQPRHSRATPAASWQARCTVAYPALHALPSPARKPLETSTPRKRHQQRACRCSHHRMHALRAGNPASAPRARAGWPLRDQRCTQGVCAKLRKPLRHWRAHRSPCSDTAANDNGRLAAAVGSTPSAAISVRLRPAPRHSHRPRAAPRARRHRPAR